MNKQRSTGANKQNNAQEEMRMRVVDMELRARFWKAQYEIRKYTLETNAMEEEYNAYMQDQLAREKEQLEKLQEQIKINNEQGVATQLEPAEHELEGQVLTEE